MAACSFEQCPDRRVEARALGQRAVVEVDRGARSQLQDFGGKDREVGDAEEIIDLLVAGRSKVAWRAMERKSGPTRPLRGRTSRSGDYGNYVVTMLEQRLAAFREQRFITDDDSTKPNITGIVV